MIQIGDDVVVSNQKLFSYRTQGVVVGESGVEGMYKLVHWLDGAPPLRILARNLQVIPGVRKFWMVVGDIGEDQPTYIRSTNPDVIIAGQVSPARKFYDKADAENLAQRLRNQGRTQWIVMEAVEVTTNNGGFKPING